MPTAIVTNPKLSKDLLDVLDVLAGGVHAGLRPAHAKGVMCEGTFAPSPEATQLTWAPHASRPSTPVTVRFSDGTGLPSSSISPEVANTRPRSIRTVVVLPDPLGPRNPYRSPSGTSRLTPSTASMPP